MRGFPEFKASAAPLLLSETFSDAGNVDGDLVGLPGFGP